MDFHRPAASSSIVAETDFRPPGTAAYGPDNDGDEINIGEMIATLLEFKWLIAALTALALIAGVLTAFVATPIYRADALVQIEEGNRGLLALQDVQSMFGERMSVGAELEILQSRMIMGRVVDRLGLTIRAEPHYFPFLGRALARRHGGDGPVTPLFGLNAYAWGGERIRVESLEVPPAMLGEPLTLVAGQDGEFSVRSANREPLLTGRVGAPAAGGGIALFVSELEARPGTEFTVTRLTRAAAIGRLRSQFEARERGRGSGVLELTLSGPDRNALPTVLDEILNAYVRQNVEHRSAEAESTLVFLESQLPLLKSQLDAAEMTYNNYRQTRGSVDLTIETQGVLRSVVEVDRDIVRLEQEREELRRRFTAEHPRMVALEAQIDRLRTMRNEFDQDIAALPETQQTLLRLSRDVEVSTALYTNLLHNAQQLRVARAGTVGDARIIDSAQLASSAVSPNRPLVLAISALLGLLLSFGLVFLIRALRVVVDDPETIERQLGLPVYASVPISKAETQIARDARRSKTPGLLALAYPEDDAVESLRSLRTTLHFALLDTAANSILVTGSGKGVGKSFLSKNLGVLLAQAGKKVVIVDADLRMGHIHKEFGLPREGGVTEFVSGHPVNLRSTQLDGLAVVTTGQLPPNPSEVLMHARFDQLLQELGERCDIVIVDAPPILAVSDAAIIGRHVGATLLVARAGQHPVSELEQAVKRLAQAGVQVKGVVFNGLDVRRQRYRYGYSGYVYRYRYQKQ